MVPGGSKVVNANFGGKGNIKITGNSVNVNCGLTPCNYSAGTVVSTPLAKIKNDAGVADKVGVANWGEFGVKANECPEGKKPSVCVGPGTTNCIVAGDTASSLDINGTDKSLKFFFPNNCPGTNNISVFHRPSASNKWKVILRGQNTGVTADLLLYFNDPNSSNR
jgi:hypothetical protein